MSDAGDRKQHNEAHATLPRRIAYVLAYRAPGYVRTESLLAALRFDSDMDVVVARNTHAGVRRYLETWKALRCLRAKAAPDIYLLGFRGHEIFWPIRWLSHGKPLIFDAMMSPYAALREENDGSLIHRLLAKLIYPFERRMLRRADLVLTDTQLHSQFYAQTFSLPLDHFCAVPVGSIESEDHSETSVTKESDTFSVLFYGSFLPLHGIDTIVEAAAQLANLPIRFDFVGGNKSQARRLHRLCQVVGVTNFTYRRWVAFEHLLQNDILDADLCLGGPFGDTPQARRVVTGKTSQCLALGKATVIGHIDEDYGFVDRSNCLLVAQGNADALAASIRWAFEHRASLPELGARGRDLYLERLSTHTIAARLRPALLRLTADSTTAQTI
jgi:glycosyltransferase involved in cell wall biosynthesis